jgi:trimethylamine:corrinoid methyltransferase-like protein
VQKKGFAFKNNRVCLDRGTVRAFLDAERAKGGRRRGMDATPPETNLLTLGVSQYSQNVRDVATGEVRPYTLDTLTEAAKVVDVLADRGVRSGAPGTPMDVAPDLQPVALYYLSLKYTRHGTQPLDPRSVSSHRFILDMAEAAGHPVKLLPVYLVSPLGLAGGALDAVLAYKDRIDTTWVISMPSAGASAPLRPGDAYAMTVAEVIGSAIIMRELVDLEVGWEIQLFPFDLRQLSLVFGSPENFLMQLASAEVDAYFHGKTWKPAATNIHTMAKTPGIQASAEKASLMMTGALLGARHFVHAGTLSLDEIFSTEQLIIDCEIKDHVAHMVKGLDTAGDPDNCIADVSQGIVRGFMGLDSTLENYREQCWYPRYFDRGLLGASMESGASPMGDRIRAEAAQLPARHDYALPGDVQKTIDQIYASAQNELTS